MLFIHSFVPLLAHIYSVSCVPGTVPGIEDMTAKANGRNTCNHRVPALRDLADSVEVCTEQGLGLR